VWARSRGDESQAAGSAAEPAIGPDTYDEAIEHLFRRRLLLRAALAIGTVSLVGPAARSRPADFRAAACRRIGPENGPGVLFGALPEKKRGYLANPGMGYQGWTDAVGLFEQGVEYRRGDHREQGGFDWATLNPAEEVFDWTPIDEFLAGCSRRGVQGSFRVLTMNGTGFGGHRVPRWVIDLGVIVLPPEDEPDYRSRQYQEHWGTFLDALAHRYDGDPRIAFIDISGYGQFNEWQAYRHTDHADDVGDSPSVDSSTRRHLVHMYVGGAGEAHVIEADGRSEGTLAYDHPGFRQTQLVMPYGGLWSSSRYVLRNHPHVGFRNDALFGPDARFEVLEQIGFGITDVWRRAPVVFEPIAGADFEGQYDAAAEVLRRFHASYLHENDQLPGGPPTESLVERLGYRYVCTEVRAACLTGSGSTLRIETTWSNIGWAKAYPRTGQILTVTLALADATGAVVLSLDLGHDVSSWLPGEQHRFTDEIAIPPDLTGEHTVLVGIVQRNQGRRIALALADQGRTDRWYPVTTVLVVAPSRLA
jgi:Domain of unknown function (DUF4832)